MSETSGHQSLLRQWMVRQGNVTATDAATTSIATTTTDGGIVAYQSAYKQQLIRTGGGIDFANGEAIVPGESSGGGGNGGGGGGGDGTHYPDEQGYFDNPVLPYQINSVFPLDLFYGRRRLFAEGSQTEWVYVDIAIAGAPHIGTSGTITVRVRLSLDYTMQYRDMTREEVFALISAHTWIMSQTVRGAFDERDTSSPTLPLGEKYQTTRFTYGVLAPTGWKNISFSHEINGMGDYR